MRLRGVLKKRINTDEGQGSFFTVFAFPDGGRLRDRPESGRVPGGWGWVKAVGRVRRTRNVVVSGNDLKGF